MATFNGHKNWNHWNVSLWINNDEALYSLAHEIRFKHPNLQTAANELISMLPAKTPDGARYSKSSVIAAIKDI